MAEDVETPAAESSPAEPEPQPTIPSDPEAYAEWRQTGKLPDAPPSKREAPAPSTKPSVDEESEKGAPVSETGSNKGRSAEQRIKQLVSERDSIRAKLEALEAGKKDATAESSPAPAKDAKAESSPAPESPQRPVKPKQDSFDSWDAYETAQDKYLEDLADWKAGQRIEANRQRQLQDEMTREMDVRLDEAEVRYGEEAKPKIIKTAQTVFSDAWVAPAIKAALGRSEVLVDALYVMGSDEKELAAFLDLSKKDPLEALRKWFTVEALVKQELASMRPQGREDNIAPKRGPDGKFLPEQPAKRKIAPAPPVELNGNASPPGDQSERAAASGNFRAFAEDRNRKDFQRYKGQL
jgi:hypothetical protein